MEGWRKMNLIHRFILEKLVGVNQNPKGVPSLSRDMLGSSESAYFLPLYGISKLLKFIWDRSVITKLSDGLKTCIHNKIGGESVLQDSPSESR
jgi:hypothetical protein